MEDLEFNPLHRAFLGKFRREFDIACEMSYLIAIPHSETLLETGQRIDQNFVSAHILMPSKLLKFHYNPLQKSENLEDIELDGKKLIVRWRLGNRSKNVHETSIVRILDQEIGYNIFNKEYRIILIDSPLVCPPNATLTTSTTTTPEKSREVSSMFANFFSPSKNQLTLVAPGVKLARRSSRSLRKSLRNHDDCFEFLDSISQELSHDLETDIKRLQSTYLILPDYLDDAAGRLKQLADSYVLKFELSLRSHDLGDNNLVCGQFSDSCLRRIRLAVENNVVHLMHGKLMVAVQECCEKEDQLLAKQMRQISKSRPSICQLGAQNYFSAFQASTELVELLCHLPEMPSPITMVNGLLKVFQLISENLNQSVELRRLMSGVGDFGCESAACCDIRVADSLSEQYNQKAVSICSDDLIATLIYLLAQAKPNNYFSMVKYLELFGWTSISQDQEAYFTATVQMVVQYILNCPPCFSTGGCDHKEEAYEQGGGTTTRTQKCQHLMPNDEYGSSFETNSERLG